MKKKVMIGSILAVFLIMITSIGSVMGSETETTETKESPLYKIRTKSAITEKVGILIENIKTRFLSEERIVFVPLIENIFNRDEIGMKTFALTLVCSCPKFF